jgi:hypothetical protein
MMPQPAMSATPPPSRPIRPQPSVEDLASPATQLVQDRDAYLGRGTDIGRRLDADQVELFVSEEPSVVLQRELARLQPQYIALHDVGTSASLRLLQHMAATTGRVLRLTIRRQGQGIALATLQFVEITGSDGSVMRVYSTDVDADSHNRHEIARVLVSHARLAVLAFGDLPVHALNAALQPLTDALNRRPWPNGHVLMVPLGAPAVLKNFAASFGDAGVQVRVTPRMARVTDAWSFIGNTWNQIDNDSVRPGYEPTIAGGHEDIGMAPTEPMSLNDPRLAGSPASGPVGQPRGGAVDHSAWADYVRRCARVKGVTSCCVFDRRNGQTLAHAGGRPPGEVLQVLGEQLLTTTANIGALVKTGAAVQEISVSYASHHLLLRTLPGHEGIVLHALLDAAAAGNIALARSQLQRVDPP